jgi:hypothetical protein
VYLRAKVLVAPIVSSETVFLIFTGLVRPRCHGPGGSGATSSATFSSRTVGYVRGEREHWGPVKQLTSSAAMSDLLSETPVVPDDLR